MAKLSKRAKAIAEAVDSTKQYPIEDALNLLKSLPAAKFVEAVDVSVNLGVDPRKSDQVVRGSTVLPNGTGKTVRVAVFTQGDNVQKALDAGADVVGMDDLHDQIKGGDLGFDVVIANQALHHVLDLEHLFSTAKACLTAGSSASCRSCWHAGPDVARSDLPPKKAAGTRLRKRSMPRIKRLWSMLLRPNHR